MSRPPSGMMTIPLGYRNSRNCRSPLVSDGHRQAAGLKGGNQIVHIVTVGLGAQVRGKAQSAHVGASHQGRADAFLVVELPFRHQVRFT